MTAYAGVAAGDRARHAAVGTLSQSGYLLTVYWAIGLGVSTGTTALIDGIHPPASDRFWFAMVWLVVLSTFGGYSLYWYLLGRMGVTRVNTLMFLVPAVTTVWGAFMFGEPVGVLTGVGLALALVATWVVTRAGVREVVRRPPRVEQSGAGARA